jgi:putative ABC transport system permease protein
MALGPILRSMRHHKGPFSLLVLEVAFGFVILVHALIGARFYLGLHVGDTGVADGELVVATKRFLSPQDLATTRRQQEDELAALARLDGVAAVAAVDCPPFADSSIFPATVRDPDSGQAPIGAWALSARGAVTSTLGLTVVAGRNLPEPPPPDGPLPLLVSTSLARRLFGSDGAAVGRTVESPSWRRARVVGVVGDFTYRGTWLPHAGEFLIAATDPATEQGLIYVVRAQPGRVAAVALAAQSLLARTPDALLTVTPLRREATRYMLVSRGATILLIWTGFLVVAVALSGSLALASFSVAERTRQIGVRRALGARRAVIIRYFLLENLVITGFGLALGLAMSIGFNLVIRRLMVELVLTADLTIASTAIFIVTGLLSALVPARRAAAIPPWAATRTL